MKLNVKLYTHLIFAAILIACSSRFNQLGPNIDGTWESLGYGKILHIDDSVVLEFDVCEAGCNFSDSASREYFETLNEIRKLSRDSLILRVGITDYTYIRIPYLPNICEDCSQKDLPIHNFEVLWNTFNEHYCYFETRNIDWDEIRKKYGPRIDAETSKKELYLLLKEMIGELNDSHVSIRLPPDLKDEIEKRIEENESSKNRQKWLSIREEYTTYLLEKYLGSYKSYNNGVINWGKLQNGIGYIQNNLMIGLADYHISPDLETDEFWNSYDSLSVNAQFLQNELSGTRMIMDSIINDFKNTRAIVVDLRFNRGGYDQNAIEIINHFTDTKRLVFTKKARLGNEFTRKNEIILIPSNNTYTGQVFLLTGPSTASAAEIAVLSSLVLPNVTRVGSATHGIFSDILSKTLPNGWKYGLSNEIYENCNEINYENIGIPPDIEFETSRNLLEYYTSLIDNQKNGDAALEYIINLFE